MKTKLISVRTAIPIIATGILGFASSATAATPFKTGDQVNLAGGDIIADNTGLVTPTLYFCPPSADPNSPNCAPLGDFGRVNITSGGNVTGDLPSGYSGYSLPNEPPGVQYTGDVKSFNASLGDQFPGPPFGTLQEFLRLPLVEIVGAEPGPEVYETVYSIDIDSVDFIFEGDEDDPGLDPGEVIFRAMGKGQSFDSDTNEVLQTFHVTYDFTGQGVFLGNSGCVDPVTGVVDGTPNALCGRGSYSGTVTVEVKPVPEPTSGLAVLAVGSLVATGAFKRKLSRNK